MTFDSLVGGIIGHPRFSDYERDVRRRKQAEADAEVAEKMRKVLESPELLVIVKEVAAMRGYAFNGFREVGVRLASGTFVEVRSPFFVKAKSKKRGCPKKTNKTSHMGLELLGFIEKNSSVFVESCVHAASICPSFDVAADMLANFGVKANAELVRQMVMRLGNAALPFRVECHADPRFSAPGIKVQICVDAGRARERRKKRGPKENGLKRQGYHTDWKAPWLLTINVFDGDGAAAGPRVVDGSCGNIDELFKLLEEHLRAMNLDEAAEVVFCADGGAGIWPRFEALAERLGLGEPHFVLDYTHAKQNLAQVLEIAANGAKLPEKEKRKLDRRLKDMLWNGDIDGIRGAVADLLKGRKAARKKVLKKIDDYFGDKSKFQYAAARARKLPIGSGAVESAIRRVINLRVKSAGSFWKKDNIEIMIFLRSLVLTGKLAKAIEIVRVKSFENFISSDLEEYVNAA